jgi:hypothetical protein
MLYLFQSVLIASITLFVSCAHRHNNPTQVRTEAPEDEVGWALFQDKSRKVLSSFDARIAGAKAKVTLGQSSVIKLAVNAIDPKKFDFELDQPLMSGKHILSALDSNGKQIEISLNVSFPIVLNLVADWDGTDTDITALPLLENFRKKFPWGRVTQFVGPYFLSDSYFTQDQKNSLIQHLKNWNEDEIAFHMHAHCHYLQLINIPCKTDDENLFAPASLFNYPDISIATMIEHAYSSTQVGKMLSFGNDLFKKHGFRAPVSYKAGGWCAGKKTYQALLRNGFKYDSSPLPAEYLKGSLWETNNLGKFVAKTWTGIGKNTQPYIPAFDRPNEAAPSSSTANSLLVFPGNLGMVDYVDNEVFDSAWGSLWIKNTHLQSPLVVNTGWHPGSFRFWQSRADHLMQVFERKLFTQNKGPVVSLTIEETAKTWFTN